jgi:hypothetical protein
VKGLWEKHYANAHAPRAYGDTTTYYRGANWLALCATIEDWGCGLGFFRTCMINSHVVTNVDGSNSRFADVIADLRSYTSNVEGIFMRHVLEHNLEWRQILKNAVRSFTKRMCLVTFTPFNADGTIVIGHTDMGDGIIPDIAFEEKDLLDTMRPYVVAGETLYTKTQYGSERVFYLEKP